MLTPAKKEEAKAAETMIRLQAAAKSIFYLFFWSDWPQCYSHLYNEEVIRRNAYNISSNLYEYSYRN
jgi:hypothetical protein